ncbi:DUF2442 domain-containing protein [Adhaeribacter arboris]|uniref:DUF2442 domain-containing protein n=1 Tax=Adhaeribacter arboris TaxID=2072846 RepID=A0A2T2YGS3_9BACT|nr:DUF2442 domain-containing protein [Adhaeribacter arboris]PSR54704.1 DUF2442 domain-containing protein [Adhaeribacter arboris]
MRIWVNYNQNERQDLKIESAKYLTDYAIRMRFNDSTETLVDFKPFLFKALHPSIKKCLDESKFARFEIADGNLNWNNYDLIFPVWNLYKGKIEA